MSGFVRIFESSDVFQRRRRWSVPVELEPLLPLDAGQAIDCLPQSRFGLATGRQPAVGG